MNDLLLHTLPCVGEFAAALQIHSAMLGRGRLPRGAAAALAAALWAVSQLLWGDYIPFSAAAIGFNALRILAAAFLFGGRLTQKLFSVVVCGGIILFYENTIGTIMAGAYQITIRELWALPSAVLIYGVLLNLLVFGCIRLFRQHTRSVEPSQRLVGSIYFCVIAGLNVILASFAQVSGQYHFMFLICLGLVLSTAIYLVLFSMLTSQVTQANRSRLQLKLEQERADALMESYQAQRRLTHEFTNHMAAVRLCLEQQDIEGAKAYLDSVAKTVAAGSSVVSTHNPLLDALLTRGYRQAVQQGVMLHFDLCDLRGFPLAGTDLVTVICNLLDNALPAAAPASPPQVLLRMKRIDGAYIVSVRNRVSREIELRSGQLPPSTKQEPGHGMGLANVTAVLARYGGEYTISCRDHWFSFTFTVPETD